MYILYILIISILLHFYHFYIFQLHLLFWGHSPAYRRVDYSRYLLARRLDETVYETVRQERLTLHATGLCSQRARNRRNKRSSRRQRTLTRNRIPAEYKQNTIWTPSDFRTEYTKTYKYLYMYIYIYIYITVYRYVSFSF